MPESAAQPIIISLATQADLDDVAQLFDQYRTFYEQTSDLNAAREFLAERIARNESVILLARQRTQAVGFVQLYPTFSLVAMRRIWTLIDLYVSNQWQENEVFVHYSRNV